MKNEPHITELQAIVLSLTETEKRELYAYRERLVQSPDADYSEDGDD